MNKISNFRIFGIFSRNTKSKTTKPELELSNIGNKTKSTLPESTVNNTTNHESGSQPIPAILFQDLDDIFNQADPVYNSLSVVPTMHSTQNQTGRQLGLFEILNEESPLRGGQLHQQEQDLFSPREYQKHRSYVKCALIIGLSALALMLALGLIYVFIQLPSNSKKSTNNDSTISIENSTIESARLLANSTVNDTDTDADFRSHSEGQNDTRQLRNNLIFQLKFPIPDLRTRNQEKFKSTISNSDPLIIPTMNSPGPTSFHMPPTANTSIVKEGIREGGEALMARQKTEDRIQKLGLGGSEASFRQYYGYITEMTKEETLNVHRLSLIGFSMDRASRIIAKKLNLSKIEAEEGIILDGETKVEPSDWCATQNGQVVKEYCNGSLEYRNGDDGGCNNLNHPKWGKSLQTFRRILLPDYDDGISSVRKSKSSDGIHFLSNPGLISKILFSNPLVVPDSRVSLLFPFWSQFIEKDMQEIVPSTGENNELIYCCENDKLLEIQHPECLPMYMKSEDEGYDSVEECITVVRSAAAPTCTFGPREQFNLNSAFIDGSTIYTPKIDTNSSGFINSNGFWSRLHGSISKKLEEMNPFWNKERNFEESKRILIAEIQHITLNEFLPLLLDPILLQRAGLLKVEQNGYYEGYDKMVDPGISNVFASTASQFYISMISDSLIGNPSSIISRNPFFGNISNETLVRDAAFVPASAVDSTFSRFIINSSIPAAIIQRGRDHGIPPYAHWRKICGLTTINNFSDLIGIWRQTDLDTVQKIYRTIDDIDLYVGGLAEKIQDNSTVGPTFGCLLADQFLRVRKGDRFWYEGDIQMRPFSLSQLESIRQTTLSSLLCDAFESLGAIQTRALEQLSKTNQIQPCASIMVSSRLNFSLWKEEEPITGIEIKIHLPVYNITNTTHLS